MSTRILSPSVAILALFTAFVFLAAAPPAAEAAPKKCFGKKVNRVVGGNNKTVRLKFKDVTWVAGNNVTVIGKPYSRICADRGRQIVRPGKGRSMTSTGRGNDVIRLHRSSNKNIVQAGLGNDVIHGSNGHDFLYGGPKKNPKGLPDRDSIYGGGGNDRIYDYSGEGNRLYGQNGSDRIYSLGDTVSDIHGGNGTDFLYFNGGIAKNGVMERAFGEKGNDRLRGDQGPAHGPAYFDGGEGDDWVYGTPFDDTIIFHSGITKTEANAGDDLIITTSRGRATVDGGPGTDTISYAAHTPVPNRKFTGVDVDLQKGTSLGFGVYSLKNLENVQGSAFNDQIVGAAGVRNVIDGGLGNDILVGQDRDGDQADGGLGQNDCQGFVRPTRCNRESPGDFGARIPLIDINEGGILVGMGSLAADKMTISYDQGSQAFRISVPGGAVPSGLCTSANQQSTVIVCPASRNNLNGMLIYGNAGDDDITVDYSVPSTMTTTLNGGTGRNRVTGGKSRDFISTQYNSAGSVLKGRDGHDVLYLNDDVRALGGKGVDGIHTHTPCFGGVASGGPGRDGVVFAGSKRGVKADLAGGYARWKSGKCRKPMKIAGDVEKLEGSAHDDHLIIGKRLKTQQGKSTLLGREGRDILDSRNGVKNTVTTGAPGARKNKVIADRKDKVIWGWGLAGY